MRDVAGDFLRGAAQDAAGHAVVAPTGTFSCRELAYRVGRLAERLSVLTAPGSLIALEAASWLVGLLAVLTAGAPPGAPCRRWPSPTRRRDAALHDARPALVRSCAGRRADRDLPAQALVEAGHATPGGRVLRESDHSVARGRRAGVTFGARVRGAVDPMSHFCRTMAGAMRFACRSALAAAEIDEGLDRLAVFVCDVGRPASAS